MGLKVPVIYDTLSDLTSDANVNGGMVVKTLGEDAIGDGKGHTFKVYDPSMGKPYDHTKHIPLSKQDVFAEIVEDNPLYGKVGTMQEDIDELKQSGQAIDTTNFLHTYSTVASMQADTSLRVGIACKTLGENTLGDGKGRTYKIYAYDVEHGLYDGQLPMANTSIVAQVIVDSIAESQSTTNAQRIASLSASVTEGFANVNDNIASTFGALDHKVEVGYMRVYDTFNEFVAAADVVAGMTVRTLGEDSIGDGKGKTYKVWDENSGQPYNPDVNIDLTPEGCFAEEFEENAIYQQVRDNTFNISQMNQSMETMEGQISTNKTNITHIQNSINLMNNTINSNYQSLDSRLSSPFAMNSIDAMGTAGVNISEMSNGAKQIVTKAWSDDDVPTGEEHTIDDEGYQIVYTDASVVVRIRLDIFENFNTEVFELLGENVPLNITDNISIESYHIDEPIPEPEPDPENPEEPDPENPEESDEDEPSTIRVDCLAINILRTSKNVVCYYI